MKNYQFLNKRISTPAGIIIIFLVALLAVGILACSPKFSLKIWEGESFAF